MRKLVILALGMALALATFGPAAAATQAELETKIQLLEQSLNGLKAELSEVKASQSDNYILAEKAADDAMPKWVQRMKLYGDLRFRFESTSYDDTDFNGVTKSKGDKDRFRTRLRFGVASMITPDAELGFRMATGSDDDPTSTNQTNGNYWAEFSTWGIDRAYLKYTPSFVPDKMLTFSFGKIKNPFVTSKVIYDGDVVPEGAFLNLTFNKKGTFQPFVTAAYMFLAQPGDWSDNVYAPAIQGGLQGEMDAFSFTVAASYTDYGDLGKEGNVPPNPHGTPVYEVNGVEETSEFGVWDVLAKAKFKFSKKGSVSAWGHYVQNADATGPYEDKDTAWGAGVGANYDKFHAKAWYKNVEANATPGFISDSDSGFVNRKGWVVEVGYKFWKRGDVTFKYYNTEPEDTSINSTDPDSQTFFVDAVFKF